MRRVLAPALLIALVSPTVLAQDPDPRDTAPVMERLIERYSEDRGSLRNFYSVPRSTVARERMQKFNDEWQAQLETVDFDQLGADGRIDYLLLANHLRSTDRGLAFERERDALGAELLAFADVVLSLEESRRRLEDLDPRQAAQALVDAKKSLDAVRGRVQKGLDARHGSGEPLKPGPVVAFRAARQADAVGRSLDDWFKYRDGYEPEFGWWTRKPYDALKKAIGEYAKLLRDKVAKKKGRNGDLIGDPIGAAELRNALDHEMIPYSPEELLQIAETQFAWCEDQGRKASQALGFEGDWAKVVEHVKGLHVPPGKQDDLIAKQSREAIAFVSERGLLTIPPLCEETWRLEMISPHGQKTLPFAAYSGQRMLVAYPTSGMAHEAKLMSMRGNNEHFSRIVTPHELIPGHHLQLFMADRYATHRQMFRTPFLVEGWALYWEMRLWDLGWPRGPEDRVGMLFWRMHRCARIIVTLRFHLGEMTPDEMIDFLVERVGLERDGATSEVRRYIAGNYGPLYQCAYMLGGLQMRALYGELVKNGDWSERRFHDTVLHQNSIPIELIRARLTGQKLSREFRTTWRFAGEQRNGK